MAISEGFRKERMQSWTSSGKSVKDMESPIASSIAGLAIFSVGLRKIFSEKVDYALEVEENEKLLGKGNWDGSYRGVGQGAETWSGKLEVDSRGGGNYSFNLRLCRGKVRMDTGVVEASAKRAALERRVNA